MKTTLQTAIAADKKGSSAARRTDGRNDQLTNFWRTFQLKLALSRGGRVLLHLLVAIQTGHYLWHWRGVVRELARI